MSSTTASRQGCEPVPTNWSEKLISQFAEKTATALGFKPGADIRALVENELGGTIEIDAWTEPTPSGMIDVRGPKDFTIWLSPYTAPARDVFTIAHELGHYFLHSEAGLHPIKIRREGSNRVESEANWFAANFLLPEDAFRKIWQAQGGNAYRIANQLGLSSAFVLRRATPVPRSGLTSAVSSR